MVGRGINGAPMKKLRARYHVLIAITAAWLVLLAAFPWLHDTIGAFAGSVVLLTVNAACCLAILTWLRRVPVILNLLQIALFGVLNYQLYLTFGAEHYGLDNSDWAPNFGEWLEFTIAHVCRAADLLDALDEYGIGWPLMRPQSAAAGIILVCMHLSADVFLIGLVVRWFGRFWKVTDESELQRGRRNLRWLLTAILLYIVIGVVQQFSRWDWPLFLLDSLLRLLDVGDMMQIFGWHLITREGNIATATFGLAFRFAVGAWIADILLWLHLRYLRGWGIHIDELKQILREGDAIARRGAAHTLGTCGRHAASAVKRLIHALNDSDVEVRCEAAWALGKIGPRAEKAIPALALCLWSDHARLRMAAGIALDEIGPTAEIYPDVAMLMLLGEECVRRLATRMGVRFGSVPSK